MLFHAFDLHPRHLWIAERISAEVNFSWNRLSSDRDQFLETLRQRFLGFRMITMRCLWSDETLELQASLRHRRFHEIGCFLLRIDFAAVCDGGTVEQIARDARALVPAPERLLPRSARLAAGSECVGEDRRLGEPSAWRGRTPQTGEVRGEVPDTAAAHRKTGDGDAQGIDIVACAGGGERLEDVDFAGELRGVAEATIGNDAEGVFRDDLRRAGLALGEGGELGAFLAATEEPDHEGRGLRRIEAVGDEKPVGLHGAIELRSIAADDQTRRVEPGCLLLAQQADSRATFAQKMSGKLDFLRREK